MPIHCSMKNVFLPRFFPDVISFFSRNVQESILLRIFLGCMYYIFFYRWDMFSPWCSILTRIIYLIALKLERAPPKWQLRKLARIKEYGTTRNRDYKKKILKT